MSDAYGVARELLERAEQDAARIRAEADRYLRQREQEAELLVAKARRLLAVAEQRAASLTPVQPQAPDAAASSVVTDSNERAVGSPGTGAGSPRVVDLDAYERSVRDGAAPIVPTGLDDMLKTAIAKAVDRSFHLGT